MKPKTSAEYLTERRIAALQQIQKSHPYGSKPHRDAYEKICETVLAFYGKNIGPYDA